MAKPVPVKLLFAYWPLEDQRHEAGEIIEVSIELAKALIAEGKAERADKFPGEE